MTANGQDVQVDLSRLPKFVTAKTMIAMGKSMAYDDDAEQVVEKAMKSVCKAFGAGVWPHIPKSKSATAKTTIVTVQLTKMPNVPTDLLAYSVAVAVLAEAENAQRDNGASTELVFPQNLVKVFAVHPA